MYSILISILVQLSFLKLIMMLNKYLLSPYYILGICVGSGNGRARKQNNRGKYQVFAICAKLIAAGKVLHWKCEGCYG